ncbi:MAG: hypothetical protein RMJ07_01805 [Nitrososphaerota archaeon]|nr:hypothetical protein [Candidatus Bathyarchaeota archaeon]MDW8048403.1 hypothetical protein [Nitrososphaerota archaeon]
MQRCGIKRSRYILCFNDSEDAGSRTKDRKYTINFLQSLQHEDGSFDSIRSAFYVVSSLAILGGHPIRPLDNLVELLNISIGRIENPDIDIEVISEVENVYLAVDLCRMLEVSILTRERSYAPS